MLFLFLCVFIKVPVVAALPISLTVGDGAMAIKADTCLYNKFNP